MKQFITILFFTGLSVHIVTSQCLNRQPNLIYNRQLPETIVETPLIYPQTQLPVYQPTLRDIQPLQSTNFREIPPLLPSPTTIITDCTPSVCKSLVDIIQFMSVCNLIKEKKGGADVALQLAEPFIKELMLSQSLSNPVVTKAISPSFVNPSFPCANSVVRSPISSNLINPSLISAVPNPIYTNSVPPGFVNPAAISSISSTYPNFFGIPNDFSGLPFLPSNLNNNDLVNILSMLSN